LFAAGAIGVCSRFDWYGERLEPNVRARPSGMLQTRSLVAALRAPSALPQSVARCFGAPSNHEGHQGHWRVVQTFLAVDPGPAVAALKVRKRRTCPRRLPLGVRAAAPVLEVIKKQPKEISCRLRCGFRNRRRGVLPIVVADDEALSQLVDGPRRREATN